jgi:Ni/Fe-hydrogenase 1 B-type cytochrome subunit
MSHHDQQQISVTVHKVWDRPVRIFHWFNLLSVLALVVIGLAILNANSFGISADGKILLKIIHAWIGYAFVINLLLRLGWAFSRSRSGRWSAFLPFGKGYWQSLKHYVSGLKQGNPPVYKGHNPLGRLMISFLFVVLSIQAATGLVLAGTDLYFPPFGHEFAEWATGAGEDHSTLVGLTPGNKEMLNPEGYAAMRKFREPFIAIHEALFYVILLAGLLHIAAIVFSELTERHGLVSAMIHGRKSLDKKPVDD